MSSAPGTIRVATFNAAMFSMAPAVPPAANDDEYYSRSTTTTASREGRRLQPKKGILKPQCPPPLVKQLRVSINLQDNDTTIERPIRNATG